MTPAHKSLEGQIVAVIVAACGVATTLNPSTFPPKWAGALALISTVALIVEQFLLKLPIQKATAASIAAPATTVSAAAAAEEFVTMYDDVNVKLLPTDAQAVAGYTYLTVDGESVWEFDVKKYPALAAKQRVVSICNKTDAVARIIDVEPGNPTGPAAAVAWVEKMVAHGVYRPGIYASVDEMRECQALLVKTSLRRDQFVLWLADWNGLAEAKKLLAQGYDAVQYTDKADNVSLDESLCKTSFFPPLTPAPAPKSAELRVTFGWPTKHWSVEHLGARIHPEKAPGRDAHALVTINTHTGVSRVEPLPWDFKK